MAAYGTTVIAVRFYALAISPQKASLATIRPAAAVTGRSAARADSSRNAGAASVGRQNCPVAS
jgi:hypothetical protein